MKLHQILIRTLTEEIDYTDIPPEIANRLKQLKQHEQEWGIKEYHSGESINNIIDSIAIYNDNVKDNRYSKILARHNPNYKNIFNFTSRIIHNALTELEELKAPKSSNRKLQESRRNWSIEEPPYSEILVNNNRLKIIKVQRIDNTSKAAKITSDMSYKSGWCTVNVERADHYLRINSLHFILLDGEKYLCHIAHGGVESQLMDFRDEPVRISEDVYNLLSEYIPDVGLFMEDKYNEIYKNTIIKYPLAACNYAINILKRRWPEAEPTIIKSPWAASLYARDILKRRWPEAESTIMKHTSAAISYARYVLKRRWPEIEPIIMKDSAAIWYARHILKRRWPEAEPNIMEDPNDAVHYAQYVIKGEWPEAEPYIMKDNQSAYYYALHVLKRRWPEAESYIMKDPLLAYMYTINVINKNNKNKDSRHLQQLGQQSRWPEAEPYIMENPEYACNYAINVIEGRWPEAEPYIMKNPEWAYYYARFALRHRWPEAEPQIIKEPLAAANYACYVIKDRWPEAEQTIMKEPSAAELYNLFEFE